MSWWVAPLQRHYSTLAKAKRWTFRWMLEHPGRCNGTGKPWLRCACSDPTARALLLAAEDGDRGAALALYDRLQELRPDLDARALRSWLRESGYPVRTMRS